MPPIGKPNNMLKTASDTRKQGNASALSGDFSTPATVSYKPGSALTFNSSQQQQPSMTSPSAPISTWQPLFTQAKDNTPKMGVSLNPNSTYKPAAPAPKADASTVVDPAQKQFDASEAQRNAQLNMVNNNFKSSLDDLNRNYQGMLEGNNIKNFLDMRRAYNSLANRGMFNSGLRNLSDLNLMMAYNDSNQKAQQDLASKIAELTQNNADRQQQINANYADKTYADFASKQQEAQQKSNADKATQNLNSLKQLADNGIDTSPLISYVGDPELFAQKLQEYMSHPQYSLNGQKTLSDIGLTDANTAGKYTDMTQYLTDINGHFILDSNGNRIPTYTRNQDVIANNQKQQQLNETKRSNLQQEQNTRTQQQETQRHNKASESTSQQNAITSRINATNKGTSGSGSKTNLTTQQQHELKLLNDATAPYFDTTNQYDNNGMLTGKTKTLRNKEGLLNTVRKMYKNKSVSKDVAQTMLDNYGVTEPLEKIEIAGTDPSWFK